MELSRRPAKRQKTTELRDSRSDVPTGDLARQDSLPLEQEAAGGESGRPPSSASSNQSTPTTVETLSADDGGHIPDHAEKASVSVGPPSLGQKKWKWVLELSYLIFSQYFPTRLGKPRQCKLVQRLRSRTIPCGSRTKPKPPSRLRRYDGIGQFPSVEWVESFQYRLFYRMGYISLQLGNKFLMFICRSPACYLHVLPFAFLIFDRLAVVLHHFETNWPLFNTD